MTQKEYELALSKIMSQEKTYGVKIHISDIIDKDHLDCTWYGGEVATIQYEGYIITIGAYGDIRLSGIINGEEIYIKDKNNGGEVYNELGHKLNDETLHELLESEDENNYLCFQNSNWFEVDLISPNGEWIDLFCADNVLDDNLLDCLMNISYYFEYVEMAKKGWN